MWSVASSRHCLPSDSLSEDGPTAVPTDLAIRKMAPASVRKGQNMAYAVGVVNNGPASASDVVMTDILPPGVTFVSAFVGSASRSSSALNCTTPPGIQVKACTFSAGQVTCNVGTLAPFSRTKPTGALAVIYVRVTAAVRSTVTNTATVSATNPDPVTTNNSSTVTDQGGELSGNRKVCCEFPGGLRPRPR